jgi:D-3-phosphoglycerate dehydrogenase
VIEVLQVDPAPDLEPFTYEQEALQSAGARLVMGNCATPEELIEKGQGAEILWLAWKPKITSQVMEALPRCRLVVRWGVGFDQIDVEAATRLGIAVANSPTYCTIDVAEHTIALLVAMAREVTWFNQRMHAGAWPGQKARRIHRLTGRVLGILGVGRIGAAVSARAAALGLRVIGYDPNLSEDVIRARGVEPVELDRLLKESDFVSLHLPLTVETRHLINAATLARMKPDAILINAGRGPLVDEAALVAGLEAGHLAGAALDVFESEPLAPTSGLVSAENVTLTSHIAGYSIESWADLRAEVCRTSIDWMKTGWASTILNPQVRGRLRRQI